MITIMPRALPWAEYEQTLTPLESRYALAKATDAEALVDDVYLYSGLVSVLQKLQVGFFQAQTINGLQYHLVQLGANIPDCERTLLWRNTGDFFGQNWLTADEQAVAWPDNRDIISHLQAEAHLRFNAWENYRADRAAAESTTYWQAYKLTSKRGEAWVDLVQSLQALRDQGHSTQDIHDLLYHHDAWQARNPEIAGMPRDLVLRMHGLADALPLIRAWEEIRD